MKCADCGANGVELKTETWNRISVARCERCWMEWAGTYAPEKLKAYENGKAKEESAWKSGNFKKFIKKYAQGGMLMPKEYSDEILNIEAAAAAPATYHSHYGAGPHTHDLSVSTFGKPEAKFSKQYFVTPESALSIDQDGLRLAISNTSERNLSVDVEYLKHQALDTLRVKVTEQASRSWREHVGKTYMTLNAIKECLRGGASISQKSRACPVEFEENVFSNLEIKCPAEALARKANDTTPTGCTALECYRAGNFNEASSGCVACDHYLSCSVWNSGGFRVAGSVPRED